MSFFVLWSMGEIAFWAHGTILLQYLASPLSSSSPLLGLLMAKRAFRLKNIHVSWRPRSPFVDRRNDTSTRSVRPPAWLVHPWASNLITDTREKCSTSSVMSSVCMQQKSCRVVIRIWLVGVNSCVTLVRAAQSRVSAHLHIHQLAEAHHQSVRSCFH